MQSTPEVTGSQRQPSIVAARGDARRRLLALTAGGIEGNEQLTATNGVILIVLFAVIGVTILRVRQLISVHLFVGLLLLGPVALKMASTGYRFVRYYIADPVYRQKGPPELGLRLFAPIVVLTTVAVFVTGVLLLIEGPRHRGQLVGIHKVSFIVWLVFMAAHVLGHLPSLGRSLRGNPGATGGGSAGGAGRLISLVGAVVAGCVLAIVLIPDFGAWTAHGALLHHQH